MQKSQYIRKTSTTQRINNKYRKNKIHAIKYDRLMTEYFKKSCHIWQNYLFQGLIFFFCTGHFKFFYIVGLCIKISGDVHNSRPKIWIHCILKFVKLTVTLKEEYWSGCLDFCCSTMTSRKYTQMWDFNEFGSVFGFSREIHKNAFLGTLAMDDMSLALPTKPFSFFLGFPLLHYSMELQLSFFCRRVSASMRCHSFWQCNF